MDFGQKGLKGLFQGVERGSWGDCRLSGEWSFAKPAWESAGLAGRMLFVSVPDGNVQNNDPGYRSGVPPTHQASPGGKSPSRELFPEPFFPGSGSRYTVYLWVTGMQKVSASSQAK